MSWLSIPDQFAEIEEKLVLEHIKGPHDYPADPIGYAHKILEIKFGPNRSGPL